MSDIPDPEGDPNAKPVDPDIPVVIVAVLVLAFVAMILIMGLAINAVKPHATGSAGGDRRTTNSWADPMFVSSGFEGKVADLGVNQLQCSLLAQQAQEILDLVRIAGPAAVPKSDPGASAAKKAVEIILAKGVACIQDEDRPPAISCVSRLEDACAFEFK